MEGENFRLHQGKDCIYVCVLNFFHGIGMCIYVGLACVEPVKDTVVHSAGPGLALTEKTLKAARELFFGGHCLPFSGDCLMSIL